MLFIDTNYFLRFLINDSSLSKEAKNLFEKAAFGKKQLFTSLIVFFEIYWVLTSFYGRKKPAVSKILTGILEMTFIKLKERKILEKALVVFNQTGLDLEDSYNLIYAKENNASELLTFDLKLSREFKKY